MQLSKIVMTSLLGFALASPVERRTAAEIEADIATISSDLTSFNTAINAFTGSLLQALSLLTSYNTLASAITAATSEVTSTGALAAADSATIYADVDSLTAQISDTLSDATAKVRLTPWKSVGTVVLVADIVSLIAICCRVVRLHELRLLGLVNSLCELRPPWSCLLLLAGILMWS